MRKLPSDVRLDDVIRRVRGTVVQAIPRWGMWGVKAQMRASRVDTYEREDVYTITDAEHKQYVGDFDSHIPVKDPRGLPPRLLRLLVRDRWPKPYVRIADEE